jgi:hydrogenase maturation protein HypF
LDSELSGSGTPCLGSSRKLLVTGQVQGVGFRPFVYRLASDLGLTGWVRNTAGRVEILIQGEPDRLRDFASRLIAQAPPLAMPHLSGASDVTHEKLGKFVIADSDSMGERDVHVPPDYFACEECQLEMRDPRDRRYRYPFINCTQCGPRYTIIDRLPYDRPNTSMSDFPLCPQCQREYTHPLNRRFHAEPVACPVCGPSLRFKHGQTETNEDETALAQTISVLRSGGIVAVRGIGGYHLMCDAANETAVTRLRERKHRPHKPLAVMVPQIGADGCDAVRRCTEPTDTELALLCDPRRPIVLCWVRPDNGLAKSIAPGLQELGLFLPYSPLHHLILDAFGGPLVATSGNISGEPVLTDPDDVEQRLGAVADRFLHHNRPIRRPADDSVYRVIADHGRPLRIGRGVAPLGLQLSTDLPEPVLAVGAHMKNTIALGWRDRAVISPHIGELDSPRSLAVFAQVIEDLQRLYGIRAEHVVCDAHPSYASSRWARSQSLPVTEVYHHHAHAAAVFGEFNVREDMLVFTWDGTGYGEDGSIWGGEGFLGRPGRWRRVTSFRPFRLPGGDKAGREPWRSAVALCWEMGRDTTYSPDGVELAFQAWQRDINCAASTAVGRLFDAAASLLDLCQYASFEGQGPMMLEAAADERDLQGPSLPLFVNEAGVLCGDWEALLTVLLDEKGDVAEKAARFHAVLAQTLCAFATRIREQSAVTIIGLSGGVFQNRRLTETVNRLLQAEGFTVLIPTHVPCNDAGISYGQIIDFAYR